MMKFPLRYIRRIAAMCIGTCALQALSQPTEVDSEVPAAQARWAAVTVHNPDAAVGCAMAIYPSVIWEKVRCKAVVPRVEPKRRVAAAGGDVAGNGDDYVAQAIGLIHETVGTFPSVTGVTSEQGVGIAAFGGGGILGPNEYALQINTNDTATTSACAGHTGCTVWQQFIYAPDYVSKGSAAVFMQYWLIGWGSTCPANWKSAGDGNCYANSSYVAAPDMKITALGHLRLSGSAVAGGNDTVVFNNGTRAYSVTVRDSVLDISSVWRESEWNVVGNAGGSRADFNVGSSITAHAALTDGSVSAPFCVPNQGTTGETNNLTLGHCTAAGGTSPSIQFTESN